jgi:hypothetical protein
LEFDRKPEPYAVIVGEEEPELTFKYVGEMDVSDGAMA